MLVINAVDLLKLLCLLSTLALATEGFMRKPVTHEEQYNSADEPWKWRQPDFPWYNWSLPTAQRVQQLISAMTLEEKVTQLNSAAPSVPRLALPSYDYWSEAAHGVAWSGRATVFPASIGMAASFDVDAIRSVGLVCALVNAYL